VKLGPKGGPSEEQKRRNSDEEKHGKDELGVVTDNEGRRVEASRTGLRTETALGGDNAVNPKSRGLIRIEHFSCSNLERGRSG